MENRTTPLHTSRKFYSICIVLLAMGLIVSLFSIAMGATPIALDVVINTIFGLEGETKDFIIYKYRMPRVALIWLVGLALGAAGVVIQHTLNNGLASPKIIGINSGAAFFTLLVTFAFPQVPVSYIPLIASIGGIIAGTLTYTMSWSGGMHVMRFAMIGIAIGYTFDSAVDFILFHGVHILSPSLVWLAGSFWGRTWAHVQAMVPVIVLFVPLVYALSYRLEVIRLGDSTATGVGIPVEKIRFILLLSATILASTAVGVAGVLGFVALITPHMAAAMVGSISRRTGIVAGLLSINLILLADLAGRVIAPPIEVAAGVIIALFGSPYFIYLLSRYKGNKYA